MHARSRSEFGILQAPPTRFFSCLCASCIPMIMIIGNDRRKDDGRTPWRGRLGRGGGEHHDSPKRKGTTSKGKLRIHFQSMIIIKNTPIVALVGCETFPQVGAIGRPTSRAATGITLGSNRARCYRVPNTSASLPGAGTPGCSCCHPRALRLGRRSAATPGVLLLLFTELYDLLDLQ